MKGELIARHRTSGFSMILAVLAAVLFACAEPGSDGTDASGTGAAGNHDIDVGSGSGGQASGGPPGQNGMGGEWVQFEECVGSAAESEPFPAVIQIVLDTSYSMLWTASGSHQNKLRDTADALLGVIEQMPPTSAIGLTFYPNTDGCYAPDPGVPLGLLGPGTSMQREAIYAALQAAEPEGSTPTHMAYLYGLERLAETKLPGQRYLLLITDGTPTFGLACSGDGRRPVPTEGLVLEAQHAYEASTKTFVVGSPGSEDALEALSALARNGGTGPQGCSNQGPDYCHIDMTASQNFQADLAHALADIARSTLRCDYEIPSPPGGQQLDPELVNVQFTAGDGEVFNFARSDDGPGCGEGWRYSDDGTEVVLCEDTCQLVRSDMEGSIRVVFGCDTVTVVR